MKKVNCDKKIVKYLYLYNEKLGRHRAKPLELKMAAVIQNNVIFRNFLSIHNKRCQFPCYLGQIFIQPTYQPTYQFLPT